MRAFTTRLAWTLLASFTLPSDLSAQPGLHDDLLQQERALVTALQANDRRSLDEALDGSFVMRGYPDITREEWLDRAIDFCWGRTFALDEFAVQDDGGVVVATFVLTFDQDPVTCQPAMQRSLVTDVWARRGADWKLLVRHSSGVTTAGSAGGLQQQFAAVPPPDPAWQLDAELSIVATSGNTATQTIGTTTEFEHDQGAWNTTARSAFVRSTADGLESARSLLLEARPGRELTPRLTLFARAAFRRDVFAGIDRRLAASGGLAYEVLAGRRRELDVEGGLGVERERRIRAPELRFASAQGRATYRWRFTPELSLANETGVSVDLEDGGNWRGTNKASLTVAMTRLLSLKLSHALEFLNEPVPGFRRLDTITSAGLVVGFAR